MCAVVCVLSCVCVSLCVCVLARPSFQTDVLAGQIVSSVLVPFVALAGRCFKAGNFNDDVMHTVDKIINRSSFLYTRHALAVLCSALYRVVISEPRVTSCRTGRTR